MKKHEDTFDFGIVNTSLVCVTRVPGSGKTMLLQNIYSQYNKWIQVAGISTREVRQNNQRAGFRIVDLIMGKKGWLARSDPYDNGARVGRFRVH